MESLLNNIGQYLATGNIIAYFMVFIAGILTSFTPCVYPVMPIVVGYVGGQSSGSRAKGFVLSLSYVLGMALTYAVIGAIAALTGSIFGQWQTNPIIYLVVANVCILLGLSMLEVYEFNIPQFLRFKGRRNRGEGILAAFIMGLTSGFVLGPCTTPVLAVILAYVGTKQNIIFGASILFVFALGMGMLLVVLGTFAGLLANMPKAGMWMVRIKKIFGFLLIFVGEYFIYTAGKLSI